MMVQVVWYKRDLRVSDHAALAAAASEGPVIPLYVVEPDYWKQSDVSYRQYRFLRESLVDLNRQLEVLGGKLIVRTSDVISALAEIENLVGPFSIHTHEETGSFWTYERDMAVRRWVHSRNLQITEYRQHGVFRGKDLNRDRWAKHWDRLMSRPVIRAPSSISFADVKSDSIPLPKDLGLSNDGIVHLQSAGREAAESTLNSFLESRAENYRKGMSSPVSGETSCSRLSPYLALGTLSMREVYQATVNRKEALAASGDDRSKSLRAGLSSFVGRLHWHCHFIQKLELEPTIEFEPMAKSCRGLRGEKSNPALLQAFEEGATGYPFVDACVRYLRAEGWINFRMRAMLMSFASYDLWLRWQDSGAVLARLFTDYEPGIHWPQSQMQAGVTGINALRIYSPVKQGKDHDVSGNFTRRWVPELASLDGPVIHEPWDAIPAAKYPRPIVDHAEAVREARSRVYKVRSSPEARSEAEKIYERHGSRRRPGKKK